MTVLAAEAAPMHIVAAQSGLERYSWLIIAIPLVSAGILLVGGRRTDRWGHLLGAIAPVVAFGYGAAVFAAMLGRASGDRSHGVDLISWIPVGQLQVDIGLLIDPLSMCFVLLITGVGSLIHIYAVGYMEHDPKRRTFFGYFNLFVAAMLLLVLGNNFVALYVGWEGVGLASYLLIGFWQERPTAATAAKKAFVVNRVGDFGLAIAIFIMFATFGSVSFQGVFNAIGDAGGGTATAIGLLLLLGACGKSAQVPLQAWLLDAMEGPTPVSALIHAATMVTAGVYLITRANPIFAVSSTAQLGVVVVGAVTLVFGAIIGCAKDDIKKALAASTMSQIGYMIFAAGLGNPVGYVFAIAHLLTHGFFKAGLFLGAGSVMHGMNEEVDMRRLGGLRTVMPVTYATFGLGFLAIIGIPPFSGYFSKDGIIEAAFARPGTSGVVLGIAALAGAGITAFYMSRVMLMTFFGDRQRWQPDVHPHESPPVMTVPMIVLAVGSVVAGGVLVLGNRLAEFLAPVLGSVEEHVGGWWSPLGGATLAAVIAGVLVAYAQYSRREVSVLQPSGSFATVAARRDLYGDAFNETVFMLPGQYFTRILVYFDNRGIDGVVNGIAALVGGSSALLRRLQTGFVRSYALSMFVGAAVVVAAMLVVRL